MDKELKQQKSLLAQLLEIVIYPQKMHQFLVKLINKKYNFYYSLKGEKDWTLLCKDVDASYLSTATAGGFTGSVIGLYAVCK